MSKGIQFRNKKGEKIYPCPYYPIGAIYMSVDSTNPENIFGGSWEQIKGRFLLGVGQPSVNGDNTWGTIGNTNYNSTAGTTGGQSVHTLTLPEIPSHNHAIYSGWSENSPGRDAYRYQYWGSNDLSWKETPNLSTGYRGGDGAHNNMPPYFAVYIWRRTK
jgi:hypothetical protein